MLRQASPLCVIMLFLSSYINHVLNHSDKFASDQSPKSPPRSPLPEGMVYGSDEDDEEGILRETLPYTLHKEQWKLIQDACASYIDAVFQQGKSLRPSPALNIAPVNVVNAFRC